MCKTKVKNKYKKSHVPRIFSSLNLYTCCEITKKKKIALDPLANMDITRNLIYKFFFLNPRVSFLARSEHPNENKK